MAEVSIKISDELEQKLAGLSDLVLAKLFEKALKSELERRERKDALEKLNDLFKNSELTDKDCLFLGEQVKEDLAKRLQE